MSTDRQTDMQPDFYNVETDLDRLLVLEIHIIPIFENIVRAVLEIVNIYIPIYVYIYIYIQF